LHLIATHYGSARPFAPAVDENDAVQEPFKTTLFKTPSELNSSAQQVREWNGNCRSGSGAWCGSGAGGARLRGSGIPARGK
jgi:hypothetical protein